MAVREGGLVANAECPSGYSTTWILNLHTSQQNLLAFS